MIKVAVCGAAGKMGKEVVKAISREKDLKLVCAIDHQHVGEDAGKIAGIEPLGISIENSLESSIQKSNPQVLVDFTRYDVATKNIEIAVANKVACVVGTTGFSEKNFQEMEALSKKTGTPIFIAPNFAIGAVLLMKFAKEASKYFSSSEIIELHHDKKLDAPSGTAARTAQMMLENRSQFNRHVGEEKTPNVRGGNVKGISIHSVRLPGFVAHEEVLFGGLGEILTLRHDSVSRESFMPGVVLAIHKVRALHGLVVGLEQLMHD